MEMLKKVNLPIVKMRMFDIQKDIWSHGFTFILQIIHIHFNIVLTFEIEPKQGNVKNVNRFNNEGFIFHWILEETGSNCCCYTKYPQLFLLDTQQPLISAR